MVEIHYESYLYGQDKVHAKIVEENSIQALGELMEVINGIADANKKYYDQNKV